MLKEHRLKSTGSYSGTSADIDEEYETVVEDMVHRVRCGEDVYIKFGDKHPDRVGSIAKIKKVSGNTVNRNFNGYHGYSNSYEFELKWDKRQNKHTIPANSGLDIYYLEGYEGPTVWKKLDLKAEAKKAEKPVYDRLGKQIEVGNTVTFINSRYGTGANIDFGVVKTIEFKASKNHYGEAPDITTIIHIKTIPISDDEGPMECKIRQHERSVMVLTEDLMDQAILAKLTHS